MTEFVYGIFELLASLIETWICFKFIALFINQSTRKRGYLILSCILSLLILGINTFSLYSKATLVLAIAFICLSERLIYKIPLLDAFSIASFYSVGLLFWDFFALSILGLLFKNASFASEVTREQTVYRYLFLFLSKSLLVIYYLAIKKLLARIQLKKTHSLFIITTFGYIGLVYFSDLTFHNINLNLVINWFLLILILLLMFFSMLVYLRYCREQRDMEIVKVRNEIVDQNYKEAAKNYRENAKLYHDMHNHIQIMKSLLENKKYDQAHEYVARLSDTPAADNCIWTGNDVIDCILNIKCRVCHENQIMITIDADYIGVSLDNFVISTILSNLLDNAIEACKKTTEGTPWITAAVRHINGMILVKIENSIGTRPISVSQQLITSKMDKYRHGWGLRSVSDAVDEAGGEFSYSYDLEKFTAIATVFL